MNERMKVSEVKMARLKQVIGDYFEENSGVASDTNRLAFELFQDKGYKNIFLVKDNLSVSQLRPKRTIFSFLKGASQVNIGANGVPKFFIHIWDLETNLRFSISAEKPNATAREAMHRWFEDMTKVSNAIGGVLPVFIKDYGVWGGVVTTYG